MSGLHTLERIDRTSNCVWEHFGIFWDIWDDYWLSGRLERVRYDSIYSSLLIILL